MVSEVLCLATAIPTGMHGLGASLPRDRAGPLPSH